MLRNQVPVAEHPKLAGIIWHAIVHIQLFISFKRGFLRENVIHLLKRFVFVEHFIGFAILQTVVRNRNRREQKQVVIVKDNL